MPPCHTPPRAPARLCRTRVRRLPQVRSFGVRFPARALRVLPRVPLQQWGLSVPFQLRFLSASYPDLMGKGLSIVYRIISTRLIRQAGFTHATARMLVKEGALTLAYLEAGPMQQVHGHSITCRIAIGPQQGRRAFTLQTLLPRQDEEDDCFSLVAKSGGFSLHAGVAVRPHDRKKLEHLCCYVARPAVSEQRLALTRDGRVRYSRKTPYRDGTTHVIYEPLAFIARSAALVPKPRVNLTRFHGVFAPKSNHRVTITPVKIVACIEDPLINEKILSHLQDMAARQT